MGAYALLASLTVSAAMATPSAPAAAARRMTPVVAHIFHGDLDLRTAGGAQRMWLRIGRAAAHACGSPRTDLHLRAAGDTRRCRIAVSSKAVAALNAPLVTAKFQKAYGTASVLASAR